MVAEPPGPINNENLERFLTGLKAGEHYDTERFYLVNKNLYFFFYMLYGGGPALVNNTAFAHFEAHDEPASKLIKTQMPITESEHQSETESQTTTPQPHETPAKSKLPRLEDGIVGLQNNTFYCYMNACLQCLLPINELRDHFILKQYTELKGQERKKNSFEFCNNFHNFFSVVFSKSSQTKQWVISPDLRKLVKRNFDPLMQHDSHEFLVYLFEQLQDEQTPKSKRKFDGSDGKKSAMQARDEYFSFNPSIIDRTFSGIMKTIVTCTKCGHASETFNPFMTQSLGCKSSLLKGLQDVFDEHQIDGLYVCEKCKKASKARVKHEVVHLPKILIFHLKRFDANLQKIKSTCRFDPLLDMKP